jgi:tRNA G10  N-methylase Trm11
VERDSPSDEPIRFHVFDDCVYAYEYALANRELGVLTGISPLPSGLSNGIVELSILETSISALARRLAYFDRIQQNGSSTFTHQKALSEVGGAIASSSGKAYMTHWIYPYKGKFHPQMVRGLLNVMGVREGEKVLDPMTGSGTVNVEASLMGIDSIGIDVSPVGILASRVKRALLDKFTAEEFSNAIPDIPPSTGVRKGLERFADAPEPASVRDSRADDIVSDALRLLEFETMSICQLPGRDFDTIWRKMAGHYRKTALTSSTAVKKLGIHLGKAEVRLGDARKTELPSSSVDGIVTSPPYAIALDYVARNTIQLERLGYGIDEMYTRTMGLRGKAKERAELYYLDLDAATREMYRVLRPGRFCVVVIGDTRFDGKLLPTIKREIDFGEAAGFRLVENMRKISAGQWGLFRTESMLLFQKPN